MSLNLKALQPIAGEDPKSIRDILRRCHGSLDESWLRKALGFSDEKSRQLASGLLQAGYFHEIQVNGDGRTGGPLYEVTPKGRDLMRASAARRIRRTTAKSALAEFMDRVHLINKDCGYLYSVTRAVLFGSMLRRNKRLGDVDVAVDLKPRIPLRGNWVELFRQHAWSSGRSFRTFDEEIDWPRREVILALKARKRSLSIHSWFAFIEMERPPDFQYKVLLGDTRQIRGELLRSEQECRKVLRIERCWLPN